VRSRHQDWLGDIWGHEKASCSVYRTPSYALFRATALHAGLG
jgi:hypothetical protein